MPPPAALACVPGLEQGEAPRRCVRLVGGTVNESWHVASREGVSHT